ncbi:hypothetical protein N9K16_00765 [Alphaproteobacteria bacterium]|nr:hypothetical protein [Alphaproteobacteria bacterium]
MIKRLFRFVVWSIAALLVAVLLLLSPVAYTELACHGDVEENSYLSFLAKEHHRNEAATFLTYPEWDIVHAYDDYAKVLETGDPHDFGYVSSVVGFWSSLCALTQKADAHGGADSATKMMVYTIGVSFTAELAFKALYEESFGRVFTWFRGADHSALDSASAEMARNYAGFLTQVPWYKYDFKSDVDVLSKSKDGSLRDWERDLALGIEFSSKSAYAQVITQAVAATGQAKLSIRSIIEGLTQQQLLSIDQVTVIGPSATGFEIETPRYRIFTHILEEIALVGGRVVEIAGNDDIMLTVLGPLPAIHPEALTQLKRQGYGDQRALLSVSVAELAGTLLAIKEGPWRLEHVHDY